ncbi:MAG: TIGR02281 family clan AA aspartic protease [Methylocystis sp.]|nr:MAG: TIGR02281 family clan AA aspartic protease [Methylocystis sp.]
MLETQIKIAVIAIVLSVLAASGVSRFQSARPDMGKGAKAGRPALQSASIAPAPTRAILPARRSDEIRIAADRGGQFSTDAEVNGARISGMLVDTGATLVALSYEDASAAGLFPSPADYRYQVSTANGVAHVAKVRLHDVRIGNLVVHDVDAVVGERGALGNSLLGMTFLSKLSRFSVESGSLVLKP